MSAQNFNKAAVHARCILYQKIEDHLAADIMYQKNCMSTFLKLKRDMRTLLDDDEDVTFSGDGKVKSSGYAVLTIRENTDEVLHEQGTGTLPTKCLYVMQTHVNSG